MVKDYHLFGNWLCDYGYSNMFHVSTATYESQDMNFATKTNEHRVNYDYFEYSLTLNKKALDLSRVLTDLKELKLVPYIISYMGSTNYNMNNFEKALEYQKMALVEARKYIEPTVPTLYGCYEELMK